MERFMTPEREEYIEKLGKQIDAINDILKMDSGTVVSAELKKQLKSLKCEAETVLRKLKNNEFEIAIVGLEKAGKSTFANALMENNLLPTKDLRCTFTSTRIEYSGDDKDDSATVSFYSTDEFDKDFKDKLFKIGFPNYERYSFDTINESQFVSICDESGIDKRSNIYADVLAIIQNVNSISDLLDTPPVSFNASRINSGELSEYITDEAKARAAREVVIQSKQLSQMKNVIIFDVPGFNSPTELHKIQTLERMNSADAIIVVANGKSPSLTGEELSILHKSDDEGNPLNEKLFVFANQIDTARDITKNISDTINAWISGGFVTASNKHRIICGSALVHLQAAGLDSGDRELRSFKEREKECPNGDGVDAMRRVLADYNDKERFDVLKRRINRFNAEILKAFNDIRTGNEELATSRSYTAEQMAMVAEMIDDIRPVAEKSLLDLKAEIRSYMPSEQPLSKQIIQYITDNVTTDKYSVSDELLDHVKKHTPFIGNHDDVGRIDSTIREMKFKEMYEDFSQNVINIADKHHTRYSAQILNIILDSMGVDTSSPYRDELAEALKNEVAVFRSDLISTDHSNELYYQSLIERFSRYIYQILITSQYSAERLREFYDSIDNFYSLSVFYKKPDCEDDLAYIDIAPKDQPLCMMLLFHHYLNAADNIRLLMNDISRITGIKEVPDEVSKLVEKALSATGGKTEAIVEEITKVVDKAGHATPDNIVNVIKPVLRRFYESNEPCSVANKEAFTQYYERYHTSIRGGKLYSVDDFRADFDVDIQILQDVLVNAFVRAISMEKPFVAREAKSIDDINDYIKSKGFGAFLSANFYKIKYKETQLLDKQRREQEQNAAIIQAINGILDSLAN